MKPPESFRKNRGKEVKQCFDFYGNIEPCIGIIVGYDKKFSDYDDEYIIAIIAESSGYKAFYAPDTNNKDNKLSSLYKGQVLDWYNEQDGYVIPKLNLNLI